MLGGREREALRRVADQLCVELGCTGEEEIAGAHSSPGAGAAMGGILNSEDELLVAKVRRELARLAAALRGDGAGGDAESAVGAALDGAELVMRGELLMGNGALLPALMPSFVFLVALPVVDHDRAFELSSQTQRLIDGALG